MTHFIVSEIKKRKKSRHLSHMNIFMWYENVRRKKRKKEKHTFISKFLGCVRYLDCNRSDDERRERELCHCPLKHDQFQGDVGEKKKKKLKRQKHESS